jgi:site-specific DNA-methyltransferase (adenine-specific)
LVDTHKVYISAAYGAGEGYPHQIINKPFIGEKTSCCSQTYLVIGPFDTEDICQNVCGYIRTKFFRFMVMLKKNAQHAMRGVYELVPLQDFSKPWTDEELYKKYALSEDEINLIESMIKPMDEQKSDKAEG